MFQIKYQACPDIQGSESKGEDDCANYDLPMCDLLISREDDLRGQVEGGQQEILCGAGQLQAQSVGGAEGPVPVLPLRGHLQQHEDVPGPVCRLVPGPLVCARG